MNKTNFRLNLLTIFAGLVWSVYAFCGPSKENIQKLNNSIIFDLFINYELTEKNGNLVTIADFIPSLDKANYDNIKLESNIGRVNQRCSFNFNENGTIGNISYEVNEKIYRYDLIYEGSNLIKINIAGKPKISFIYDNSGRILTINREKGGGLFEYNFDYAEGENKALIKLFVIQGEKKRPSTQRYYVSWDAGYKIESFCIGEYCSNNIKYSNGQYILSYSFASVNNDSNIATWEYVAFDSRQNWIERKSKDIFSTRTIEYR